MSVTIDYQHNPGFDRAVKEAKKSALYRVGGYVSQVAKRLVRPVKSRKKHSAPGKPWLAHDERAKKAINFVVDETKETVWIGVGKIENGTTGQNGEPLPHVLEYGGIPKPNNAPYWKLRNQLREAYFGTGSLQGAVWQVYQYRGGKRYRSAPGFWGTTQAAAVSARAKASKKTFANLRYNKISRRHAYEMTSYLLNKKVWIAPIKVTTQKQAAKVAKTIEQLQGLPFKGGSYQSPRPVVQPAYKKSQKKITEITASAIATTFASGRAGKLARGSVPDVMPYF